MEVLGSGVGLKHLVDHLPDDWKGSLVAGADGLRVLAHLTKVGELLQLQQVLHVAESLDQGYHLDMSQKILVTNCALRAQYAGLFTFLVQFQFGLFSLKYKMFHLPT